MGILYPKIRGTAELFLAYVSLPPNGHVLQKKTNKKSQYTARYREMTEQRFILADIDVLD